MKIYKNIFKLIIVNIVFFYSSLIFAEDFKINGNDYSDDQVIISIIGEIPDLDKKSQTNYILKKLNNSNLFKSVEVSYNDNIFSIKVLEYPSINKIYYQENDRLKDEQLDEIADEFELFNLSDTKINNFIDELKKIYQSFGYNSISIDKNYEDSGNNSVNLYLKFNEGEITKITEINFSGNNSFDSDILLSKIKSKTKNIKSIFANNNFKLFQINNDLIRIKKFYESKGFIDVNINYEVEYFKNNKVIIKFLIDEGIKYYFSTIKVNNEIQSDNNLNEKFEEFVSINQPLIGKTYSINKLENLEFQLSDLLKLSGIQFYEIESFIKKTNDKVDVLFALKLTKPIYIKQINIYGNVRTYDYVIRRELGISEGDPINETSLKKIKINLDRLSIFKKVDLKAIDIDNETKTIEINVEETQTGSFNVGFSVGSLDGINFLTGLKEKNINGTGRSLEFLINTNENNKAFTLSTTEKFILNNKINHKYAAQYKENDFSKSKSYKLNTLDLDTSLSYLFSDNLYHTIGIGYQLKDYIVTNSSTVSQSVSRSSGASISFNLNNDFLLNTLNSFIKPSNGNYLLFSNTIQSPSSSSNGYFKNTITFKKFIKNRNNIYSLQTRIGNIFSLNNSEILSDDKFSLGGKWLRGFDNYGAGPRNSITSYVGGNNLLAAKFDFSKPLTLSDQNPIYLNLFNDYGIVWENKNNITSSNDSLRASYGFGLNYYSPIGPIGFSWGFPLLDEDYDIKRMFTFTIGNLNWYLKFLLSL